MIGNSLICRYYKIKYIINRYVHLSLYILKICDILIIFYLSVSSLLISSLYPYNTLLFNFQKLLMAAKRRSIAVNQAITKDLEGINEEDINC